MTSPRHAPTHQFRIVDNELEIGGLPLRAVAERVGRTPFYAYDRRLVSQRVAHLRRHLPPTFRLHYAIKANPMTALVCYLADLVDGFDVASAREMALALDAGMAPECVSFAGPGKRPEELAQAVASRVLRHVESFTEVRRLAEISERLGIAARVAVRINPDFDLKSSGMKMGGGAKPFGVDAEQVPQLLTEISACGLAFEGFHIFGGSQNLRAEAICEAQSQALELALRLAPAAPSRLLRVNIGGGFGIPYFPGDQPLDLEPVAANLARLTERLADHSPEAELIIELGRYLVGEAGIYVCRIVDRKISRGQIFLVTDGGMHHHLAASGNFGQVIRKNYPLAVGNRMDDEPREVVSVVAVSLKKLDLLGDRMELPQADIGDLIVIFQSGAYGLSASPTAFLGHPPPAEVLL